MAPGDDNDISYDTNDGTVVKKGPMGTKLVTDYVRDNSNYAGSASDEQGGGMGGSITNLGHSISGATANMSGEPK